jgi:PAS domain-containing protein
MTGGDTRRTGAGRAGRPSRAAPLALFLLLAAAIAAAGALAFAASAADLRRERERELAAIATLRVDELERWRDERLVDADGVAADPTLLALLSGEAPRPERARRDIEAWFEVLRGVGEYSAIAVVDVDGRVRLTAGEIAPDPAAPEVRAIVRRAVDERRAIISDLHRHGRDDTVHLTVASPIRTGTGPARDAVLLRIDPLRWLFRMVQSWPAPSASAEMLLVGVEDGTRAVVVNEPRHASVDRGRLSAPLSRADDPLVRAAVGPPGVFEGLDHRGVPVLSAVEPVPGTSWRLVAKVDVDDALAPLARLRTWVLAGVAALVAAAAAGAAFWWRAQLAAFERHRLAGEAARLTERKLAEEALRASEAKFRAAFEFASLGILLLGPDGRVVETNRALRRMLGSGEDELRARTFEAKSPAIEFDPQGGHASQRASSGPN